MVMGRRFTRDPRGPQVRINHRIRVPEVRVVGADGSNLGVLSTDEAIRRARTEGLDLVEVNPKASPPVCKILDFGKYKYEEKKKQREAKRKQTTVEVKELKLRPKTDEHDLMVKLRAARKFAESGNKVKLTCRFRGREITHPEVAMQQFEFLLSKMEDLVNVEQNPTMEGRAMAALVAPKPQVLHKLAQERLQREKQARKAAGGDSDAPLDDDDDADLDDSEDGDDGDEAFEA
jgi:translation initiation factor IF-3